MLQQRLAQKRIPLCQISQKRADDAGLAQRKGIDFRFGASLIQDDLQKPMEDLQTGLQMALESQRHCFIMEGCDGGILITDGYEPLVGLVKKVDGSFWGTRFRQDTSSYPR